MGWGEKNKERGRKKEGTEGWGTKEEIRQMDLNGEREHSLRWAPERENMGAIVHSLGR